MNSTPKIYVAGHRGMVGSAIIRVLNSQRCRAEKPTGAFRRMHPHSTGCTCRLPSQHPAEGAIKPLFRPTSSTPKIYVAGHRGMVGSAIIRILNSQGQTHIITRTHAILDLTNQAAVRAFLETEKPDQVYLKNH
jgi:nucleoside-diphosphate-sugar epimerase